MMDSERKDDDEPGLRERIILWLVPVLGVLLALNSVAVFAASGDQGIFSDENYAHELPKTKARWGVSYENDFFVPGGSDRDYTFGLALSFTSAKQESSGWHTPLASIDELLGIKAKPSRVGFEGGFYGFTPSDKTAGAARSDDRPFSSLVFFSTSHERLDPLAKSIVLTRLSIGALGLGIVGQVQEEFHALIGNDEPAGWDEQVSAGGEPTARYVISQQRLLSRSSNWFELREARAASVGYLTEASWGLSTRIGRLNSSWHDFNPDLASYAESSSNANRGLSERFFWAGAAVKLRAYNAFLQGQFFDSTRRYQAEELNHLIIEAWAGYTQSFANGYFVSYGLRGHSSEVKYGEANRSVLWGGLMLGKRVI